MIIKPHFCGFLRYGDCYTVNMSDCASTVLVTVPTTHIVSEHGTEMDRPVMGWPSPRSSPRSLGASQQTDLSMPIIHQAAPGPVVAQGTALLEDVQAYVPLGAHGYDVQTIGGLVLAELGRRPSEGDEISVGPVTMRVDAVERLSITRVSLHFPSDTSGP